MSTIVIDAGHGGWDNGSQYYGRREKDDNLRMALAVAEILKNRGHNVVLTRDADYFVSLNDRSYISNRANADIFVSLHRNAFTSPNAYGVENFIYLNAGDKTKKYAENVLAQVVEAGVQRNRGVSREDFAVLRQTNAPAMLLELGFISNETDNKLFDENFNLYANAIADGIEMSLGDTNQNTSRVDTIKGIQRNLNSRYGTNLVVDGIYGPKTRTAIVKGLQMELNQNHGANLTVDGIFGPRTKSAIPVLRRGDRNYLVWLLQVMLYIYGYNIVLDGIFGSGTETAVRQFQKASGLAVDGLAGPNTFEALLRYI